MFRRKNCKSKIEMGLLPAELWLIIFDIVVAEGIIRLDHCDHTNFPYIWVSFFASARHFQSFDSYWQLRLVCRKFNRLLGAFPWQSFSNSTLLPCSISTRALSFDFKTLSKPHFQRLLAETPTCERLVYLDVRGGLFEDLSDFLHAARAFPNVQRLTLRLVNWSSYARPQVSFWPHLPRTFPSLVTLSVVTTHPWVALELEVGNEVVSFEKLEILYFNGVIKYSGSRFPRLRHASVWQCTRPELEILTRSPNLESLLIRSYQDLRIDVTSCLRLKLLGIPHQLSSDVVPLRSDHHVEYIWLYRTLSLRSPEFSEQLLRSVPKVRRITVEVSPSDLRYRQREVNQLRGMKFDSFRLSKRPSAHGERFLVFEPERVHTEVTGGVLRKVWNKMHG
jgi:hypothetical protein